jgi:dihydroorotate dehydrogenase (NAD+) catalytic subunit
VHDVSRAVGIPVIGVGGIASGADAIEFAMAGAAAVQVGTATFANPAAAAGVLAGITEWCAKNGVAGFASLTGSARIGD